MPRDVKDGHYTIMVRIEHKDGTIEWRDIDYVIDATAPELVVDVPEAVYVGELMHVTVDPLEPVKEVYVTLPGVAKARVALHVDLETGLYEGEIRVPDGVTTEELLLRVVAIDLARNRVERELKVAVSFAGGC